MNLKDLATISGEKLVIEKKEGLWHVSIQFLEVIKGGIYAYAYGRGVTKASAIKDYVTDIQGKLIGLHVMSYKRREFKLPDKMSVTLR